MFRKAMILVLIVVPISGTAFSQTSDRKCEERLRNAEANHKQAVERYGEHSRPAQQRRQELRRERRACGLDDQVPTGTQNDPNQRERKNH